MVLTKRGGYMKENTHRPVFITLGKMQLQVDQIPQHKTRYPKYDKRECEKQALTHWYRKRPTEEDIYNTGAKINIYLMGPHETELLLYNKVHLSKAKAGYTIGKKLQQ